MTRKVVLLAIAVFAFALYGCDANLLKPIASSGSSAAKAAALQNNLDEGNYQAVIDELQAKVDAGGELTDDEQIILASAYLGDAGVDALNLFDALETANQTADPFAVIGSAMGTDNLSASTASDYGEATKSALDALDSNSNNDDVIVLAGISASVDTVVAISEIALKAATDGNTTVDLTTAGISTMVAHLTVEQLANQITDDELNRIAKNVETMDAASAVLAGSGSNNSLQDELDSLTNSITGGTGSVTKSTIAVYMKQQ